MGLAWWWLTLLLVLAVLVVAGLGWWFAGRDKAARDAVLVANSRRLTRLLAYRAGRRGRTLDLPDDEPALHMRTRPVSAARSGRKLRTVKGVRFGDWQSPTEKRMQPFSR